MTITLHSRVELDITLTYLPNSTGSCDPAASVRARVEGTVERLSSGDGGLAGDMALVKVCQHPSGDGWAYVSRPFDVHIEVFKLREQEAK